MNISIIRHSIRNRGGDKLTLDYCAYLLDKGHMITYWTNEVASDFEIDSRIQIKQIPKKGICGTILFAITNKIDANLVVVDLIIMACLGWFSNRRKIVYLAQDYDVAYYSNPLPRLLTRLAYFLGLALMKIPTLCVSDDLAKKLKSTNRAHVFSVPNGIDLGLFTSNENSPYQQKKNAKYTIVLYARKDMRKGFDIAVKAIEALKKISKHQDWETWILGKDFGKVTVPSDIPQQSFGFLTDQELADMLSAADIYLSASRHEGFGLLQLQAMACGCAMVGTESLSFIQDNENGLLSPNEDHQSLAKNMNTLINDDDLLENFKNKAKALTQNYSLEKSCKKFEKTLLKINTDYTDSENRLHGKAMS